MSPPDLPTNLRYQNAAPLDLDLEAIPGTVPTDMAGHAFWMVPTPQEGALPWFNGCGQLYRLDLEGERVRLKSVPFETPSVICDRKIQEKSRWQFWRRLYRFRNRGGLARMNLFLGAQNQCNTALQAFQDPENRSWRMMATVDSGRPFEFDLTTLAPVTPVGANAEWKEVEIDGIRKLGDIRFPWIFPIHLSGAHTAYDERTGEIFLINGIFEVPISLGAIEPDTYLHVWDGTGKFKTTQIIDDRTGKPVVIEQSTHQIVLTRNYIVIIDTAFRIEYARMIFPEARAVPQSAYNEVWFVPRSQLSTEAGNECQAIAKHVRIPRECVHFLADYDDEGDRVTLHLVHAFGHDVSEWNERWDARWPTRFEWTPAPFYGSPPSAYDRQGIGKYVVNARTGEIEYADFRIFENFWELALPTYSGLQGTSPPRFESIWLNFIGHASEITPRRLVELYAHHPFRNIPTDELPRWKPSGVLRWSPPDMEVKDFWTAPRGTCITTPAYVPKRGQENELEGYLLAMVSTPERSEFWIWQAGDLAAGPVAKLHHPDLKFAFPLHSAWIPEIAPRTSSYKVDLRSDTKANNFSHLPAWIREIFENDIYPAFDG